MTAASGELFRLVAAGRNVERLQWLRAVGTDDVIALGADDLGARVAAAHAEQPFDAVLDYLWGEPAEKVLIGARNEGLPRLLAMVAAGELQIETKQRPLADVADAWSSPEPSGTRVVLTP
jgi:NADPH:quinone reductase-like Zn-dependent oxidoreductase